jgi:superfamily II DNA or RNA helicase
LNEDAPLRQKEMEITEKWLGEMGGWAAMKAARAVLAAGKVEVTEKSPGLIRGFVGTGKGRLTSGLRIRGRTDVETLCTCPQARRTGSLCEHALAVGLASLLAQRPATMPTGGATTSRALAGAPAVAAAAASPALALAPATTTGELTLFLPESLFAPAAAAGGARALTAFLKKDPAGQESSRLVSWLTKHGLPCQSMPLQLPPRQMTELLLALVDHPRVFVGKPPAGQHRALQVADAESRPLLELAVEGQQVRLRLAEQPPPRPLMLGETSREPARQAQGWLFHPAADAVHPWQEPLEAETRQLAVELWKAGPSGVLRPLRWLAASFALVEESFQVQWQAAAGIPFQVLPVPAQYELEIAGSLQQVQVRVTGVYAGQRWGLFDKSNLFPLAACDSAQVFYVRDQVKERRIWERLEALGMVLQGSTGSFELRDPRQVLKFFASDLPRLAAETDWLIRESESWQRATRGLVRIAPEVQPQSPTQDWAAGSGQDWLSMEFAYRAPDGFRLSRAEALRLVRSGQNAVKGKDGRQYVLDLDRCEEFEQALSDVPLQMTAEGGRLSAAHAAYFLPFASRAALARTRDEVPDLAALQQELQELGTIMRPYQLSGVAWLKQRLLAGQGALLADDMGLGKTLQSIAVLRRCLAQSDQAQPQALVICPKSLIPNWEAEFAKFAPTLRVLSVQGARREALLAEAAQAEVLITSYQLLVRDLAFYQSRSFDLLVLDEASFVRNPDTAAAKALRALSSRARLALTGTPVENSVRDLWSIFQIILPGYLGSREHFQERFEKPLQSLAPTAGAAVTTASSPSTAERLRRLVRPFFLRRTKREVLKDLPEKIEQVLWCEMSPTQAEVYRQVLTEGREAIRDAKRRSGQGGARMTMFTVLLRLRQVCCDLRLTGLPAATTDPLEVAELSGKWPLFQERLEAMVASGGKALVFSQFVGYLQHCRELLQQMEVPHCYLDGSTTDRGAVVKQFQTDASKRVFLISLKAGGYGLNLTEADQVYLMDPWWNPAVEAQAIDRAHRFGQTQVVNAYRLVMRGTVEERILALQAKKRGLIAATVEERAPLMQGLTEQDLSALLEG